MADNAIDILTKDYRTRYSALDNERAVRQPIWKDIHDFLAPRTARFKGEQINRGERLDRNIINTAVRFAVRTLPAGMQSGITSPLRPWFRLGTPDPELQDFEPVKEWLYDTEMRMREVMSRSNIYDRLKSFYGTNGLYGTSCLFVDEDAEDVIRAHDLLMGSFMIANDAAGRVDTVYRDVTLTAIQMIERFGYKNCPALIQTAYDNGNYQTTYDLCHIVEPNRLYRAGSALPKNLPWASVWFDMSKQGKESILKLSGFHDKPALTARWDVIGEDAWGVGCGEVALGDAKQLQLMEKRKLQGIDKNVRPPMLADASMRNTRTSNNSGDTTYVNGLITGNPAYRPAYQVNPYLNELREEIGQVVSRVDEAFYKNLFLLVSQFADEPNITATAINTMREEKLLMLGPVLERLNDEALDPLIDRTFNMMQRRGLIRPAPEELQGMPLRVEYVSVLAQAQKALGIGNIERFVGFVGNLSAASGDLSPWDKVNKDELIDQYADGTAIAPKIVVGNDAAAETRQQRSKQQQAAAAMQMAAGGAQAAKTLSETDTTGDNALTRVMGIS